MSVFLDDEPYQVDPSTSPTVGQVLEQVLQTVRAAGRVVAAIRCDGQEIDSESLQRVLSTPADTYEKVEFLSGTAAELAGDALGRVQAGLMDLDATKAQAVEKLNQGQTAEAMVLLRHYFDAWRQAHEAVLQSAKLVGLDLTELEVDGTPVAEVFAHFAEQLRQLRDAFEADDHVTIADIMTYEADETTQRWIRLVEKVKEAVQAR